MNRCRCADMAGCSQTIYKLNKALDKKGSFCLHGSVIEENLKTISADTALSLTVANLQELCSGIKKADGGLSSDTEKLFFKLRDHKNSLEQAYAILKCEDTAYHEQLEKEARQRTEGYAIIERGKPDA